jgi:hypothetical protein
MIEEKNIYYEIVRSFNSVREERNIWPTLTKTRLIKLAYLVDYFYCKRYQHKLSDIEWVFYLYGPYSFSSEPIIQNRPFSIKRLETGDLDPELIELNENYSNSLGVDEFEIKQFVKKIVQDYGDQDLEELIDFIYFETEPMQLVKKRKDTLDFSKIVPEEKIIKESLSRTEISTILNKYRGALANASRI